MWHKMVILILRAALLLALPSLLLMSEVSAHDAEVEVGPFGEEELPDTMPLEADEKYIRHIHSMINAYNKDMLDRRTMIETNALIDSKYKTWKRNADLINTLLALPKKMNDAGR